MRQPARNLGLLEGRWTIGRLSVRAEPAALGPLATLLFWTNRLLLDQIGGSSCGAHLCEAHYRLSACWLPVVPFRR
jgi:hypothetical protein